MDIYHHDLWRKGVVNSQICESINSDIQKLAVSLAGAGLDTAMVLLKHWVAAHNNKMARNGKYLRELRDEESCGRRGCALNFCGVFLLLCLQWQPSQAAGGPGCCCRGGGSCPPPMGGIYAGPGGGGGGACLGSGRSCPR